MPKPFLRTKDIAAALGVHVNTVRLYEEAGYLSPIPRTSNGYRQFSPLHLEQARLAHMALRWPYLGDKTLLIELVRKSAQGDLGMAMELAYRYLAHVRVERTYAEAAVEFVHRWASGYQVDTFRETMHIRKAAAHLDVSVDMLRNWERNGLLDVPRDAQGYRQYGSAEFGRLRVIRTLLQAGFSLMAILKMLRQFDAGVRHNLHQALDLPLEESANEYIEVIADHWLTSLIALEARAQAIIQQVSRLMEMVSKP
jgi:DNA-binding transcriptional MerR regulator